ncbi:uncharacterized protein [Haliotis cracherodii]|uniref:uncharacterized protein n=1 Tax=Haliotis cracherodii TaxID=6455 RepID=UPI0039E9987E
MRNKKFAYITQSLSVCANVDVPINVEGRMFDVFLSEVDKPAIIFSVLKNNSSDSIDAKAYISSLVKKIVSMIRQFTNEYFSAVFGLLYDSDLASEIHFRESILKLTHATAKHCIPESLSMFPKKHVRIVKAFLSGIALTTSVLSVTDEASGMTAYLTRDQFRILSENVDRELVRLTTYPGTGSKTLLIEITKRLGRVGRCVLISDDQEFIARARKHNVTLDAHTLEEIKQMEKEQLLDVKSVVTTYDLDVILSVMDQPSRMWISKKIIDHPVVHSPLDEVSLSRTASEGVSNAQGTYAVTEDINHDGIRGPQKEIPTDGSSVQGATAKIRISEVDRNRMMQDEDKVKEDCSLEVSREAAPPNVSDTTRRIVADMTDDMSHQSSTHLTKDVSDVDHLVEKSSSWTSYSVSDSETSANTALSHGIDQASHKVLLDICPYLLEHVSKFLECLWNRWLTSKVQIHLKVSPGVVMLKGNAWAMMVTVEQQGR